MPPGGRFLPKIPVTPGGGRRRETTAGDFEAERGSSRNIYPEKKINFGTLYQSQKDRSLGSSKKSRHHMQQSIYPEFDPRIISDQRFGQDRKRSMKPISLNPKSSKRPSARNSLKPKVKVHLPPIKKVQKDPKPIRLAESHRKTNRKIDYPTHTNHTEEEYQIQHPSFPNYYTVMRIRTPSRWGLSRVGTAIEVRNGLTTAHRYKLNPTKFQKRSSFQYSAYTPSEYKNLMSLYKNMHLPKGLGFSESTKWHEEQQKRTRMKEYSDAVKERESEKLLRAKKKNRKKITALLQKERWRAE